MSSGNLLVFISRFDISLLVLAAVGVVFFLLNIFFHLREKNNLKNSLPSILGTDPSQIDSLPEEKKVKLIFDYLINNISYKGLDKDAKRPLLRDSAFHTYQSKKGYCGENARLAITLLSEVGIRANRIYLIGKLWEHVLIECYVNQKWYLFDGHNDETTRFTEKDLFTIPSPSIQLLPNRNEINPWVDYHRIKLFYKTVFFERLKYVRLPQFVINIAESPFLLKAFASLFAAVCLLLFILIHKS